MAKKIGVIEKIGYGLGDGASNLIWMMFIFYQMNFYTDVFGLAAGALATMLFVTRIWDMATDVIVGMIADRTQTRWGKFRPYLLWMAVPFGVMSVLTFTTPALGPSGKLIYAYVTLTLMMLVYSGINIPYGALMGVISPDPQQRTSLSAFRFSFAQGAGFVVALLTMPLVTLFGGGTILVDGHNVTPMRAVVSLLFGQNVKYFGGNDAVGYELTIILFAAVAAVMFLGTFLTTRERVVPPPKQETSTKQDLVDILHNVPWLMLCALGILQVFFVAVRGSAILFYFKYYMQDLAFAGPFGMQVHLGGKMGAGLFIVVGTLIALIATFLIQYVTRYTGRKKAFIGCMALGAISLFASFWVRPDQLQLLYLFHILYSVFTGPTAALLWAMFADSADYSEWKTGRRATGLIFSASGMSNKLGWAIGGTLAASLLAVYGYQANMVQTAHAQDGIRLLMAVVPGLGALACGIGMMFYRLESKMPTITAELAAKRAAKEADA